MSPTKKNNETPSTPSSPALKSGWKWWHIALSIVGGLIVVGAIGGGVVYAMTDSTIVPYTTILGKNMGGKTTATALDRTSQDWSAYEKYPLALTIGSKHVSLNLQGNASTTDDQPEVLSLASLDAVASANAAYAYGHSGSVLKNFWQRLSGFLGRRHEFGKVAVAKDALQELLAQEGASEERPATDAKISFINNVPTVVPSANGTGFDYSLVVNRADHLIRAMIPVELVAPQKVVTPAIVSSEKLTALIQGTAFTNLVGRAPFTLQLNSQTWTIDQPTWKTLLGFVPGSSITLGVDHASMTTYLETLRSSIDHDAVEGKLSLVNGKVQEFAAGTVGQKLNTEATITAINTAIAGGKNTATLAVDQKQPNTATADTNTLGITELVSTATTNFKGSPTNRRYNLSFGAKLLDGIIIKPGETFSLVKALGQIDAAHGWKPELVILGSDIKPEFGGGLCQVATTIFRTALNAGLPITERHNHSLRIRYYEPPVGLDATIYDPQPDLKFTNDYSTPLLLQTAVNGNDLTFSFYGTKDGRSVNLPTPTVYNQTSIPATKTVEVTTLKPGEEKCQTPGHPGADAKVTYTVTYADGHTNVQTFTSHYRALGVICQVGKKATPTPPKTTNANTNTSNNTNTPANINAINTNS